MQKLLYGKKRLVILFLFVLSSSCLACGQIESGSSINIENETEQYKKMEQELKDLKTIQVKCLEPKQYKKMKEIIYKNYFRRNNDKKHQEEENIDDDYRIIYRTEDMYQLMMWGDSYVYYSAELFGEDYVYELTEEQVIREETGKLFERLGLEFDNIENGYVIDRIIVRDDNSVEVCVKKYIKGKELSLADPPEEEMPDKVDNIVIEFGNNQFL